MVESRFTTVYIATLGDPKWAEPIINATICRSEVDISRYYRIVGGFGKPAIQQQDQQGAENPVNEVSRRFTYWDFIGSENHSYLAWS